MASYGGGAYDMKKQRGGAYGEMTKMSDVKLTQSVVRHSVDF